MLSKGRLELSDMDNADFRPRRAQGDEYGQLRFYPNQSLSLAYLFHLSISPSV